MNDRLTFFSQRQANFQAQSEQTAAVVRRYSLLRIGSFVLIVSLIVYFANERMAGAIAGLSLLLVVVFGTLVNLHNRALRKFAYLQALSELNRDEVSRLHNKFDGMDTGAGFSAPLHPYAADLDIFGHYSIFQLLNRAATLPGKEMLAGWLSVPADNKTISARQEAVKELAAKPDWRQSFEATGRMNVSKKDSDLSITDSLVQPRPVPAHWRAWAWISLVATACFFLLVLAGIVSWQWIALPVIGNGIFLLRLARLMGEDYRRLSGLSKWLGTYVDLFELIEKERFQAEVLLHHQQRLSEGSKTASRAFKQLSATVNRFDNRSNMFYQLVNALVLSDYWLFLRAHRWFESHGGHLEKWLEAVAALEAHCSIAGFAFAQPAYAYPTIRESAYELVAEQLGHPLISAAKRVTNDLTVSGKSLILITGSNMSGKSTFLRTVGVNVVLALAGAPVCAAKMEVSNLQVFTSMRTQDALEESVSSFYAELRRIRQLLDMLETGRPVLYMLDEVLKGTNSDDRHRGTEALVHQLLRKNALGFISTHDLSLSRLGEQLAQVTNYSFNNFVEGDQLIFDYKLTPGPCRSFNASQLMRNMGIEIIP